MLAVARAGGCVAHSCVEVRGRELELSNARCGMRQRGGLVRRWVAQRDDRVDATERLCCCQQRRATIRCGIVCRSSGLRADVRQIRAQHQLAICWQRRTLRLLTAGRSGLCEEVVPDRPREDVAHLQLRLDEGSAGCMLAAGGPAGGCWRGWRGGVQSALLEGTHVDGQAVLRAHAPERPPGALGAECARIVPHLREPRGASNVGGRLERDDGREAASATLRWRVLAEARPAGRVALVRSVAIRACEGALLVAALLVRV
mmetsp:Transcript_2851/g.7488  ORF Transcript_2851/g.7488 Transcript_2851/m.7488 type:complete len:259 (-) Transcript_2851:1008-1784(-)